MTNRWLCTTVEALRSDPSQFDTAAIGFERGRDSADRVADAMTRMGRTGWSDLEGAAVDQLAVVVGAVGKQLRVVPAQYDAIAKAFNNEAGTLEGLATKSAQLLETAKGQLDTLGTHEESYELWDRELVSRRSAYEAASYERADDPSELDAASREYNRVRNLRSAAAALVATAEAALDESQSQFDQLRTDEDETHERIATAINEAVDFGINAAPSTSTAAFDAIAGPNGLLARINLILENYPSDHPYTGYEIQGLRAAAALIAHQVNQQCTAVPDLGGKGDLEARFPWLPSGENDTEQGRDAILTALNHTADGCQIGVDEFEIVELSNGKWVVVLPGVTDLSAALEDPTAPFSWNPEHRTVRATWMAARESALGTGIDGNLYAEFVQDAVEAEIPRGADVMIVGHSFGADTALDLASDDSFNGAGGWNVTHVVAAAYHSRPQLPEVSDSTEVLVIQNNRDLVVVAESALDEPSATIHGAGDAWDGVTGLDPNQINEGMEEAGNGLWGTVSDLGGWIFNRGGDATDAVIDNTLDHVAGMDVPYSDISVAETFYLEPGIEVDGSQIVAVFEGGGEGGGHHQNNYNEFVEAPNNADVDAFFGSVGEAGYASPGNSYAVDVSVPEDYEE